MEGIDPIRALETAVAGLAGVPVELERPADARHGDYATNVALRLAGQQAAAAPRGRRGALRAGRAAGRESPPSRSPAPGSSTSRSTDAWLGSGLGAVLDAGRRFGAGSAETPERVQVELVSANPTGPITVAAARNGAYGDAVARLLEFAGNEVEREYYYNDAGTQMDLFRASVEAIRRGEEPPADGYQGDYMADLAREPGDPVPRMLERIEADARAVPDPLRHLRAAERRRGGDPGGPRGDRDLRGGGRRLGEDDRARGRPRPRA